MRVPLNRLTLRVLLVVLTPIVVAIKLVNAITGRGKRPTYVGTIEGDPLAYDGDRPIVIAMWAKWAAVWRASTEKVVERLKEEFTGQCEFAYVECTGRAVTDRYGASVVPVLIVRHRGHEVARFVNALDAEPVREAIRASLASSGG